MHRQKRVSFWAEGGNPESKNLRINVFAVQTLGAKILRLPFDFAQGCSGWPRGTEDCTGRLPRLCEPRNDNKNWQLTIDNG